MKVYTFFRQITHSRCAQTVQIETCWVFVLLFSYLFWLLSTHIYSLNSLEFLSLENNVPTFKVYVPTYFNSNILIISEPEPKEIPKKDHKDEEENADNDNSSELEQPQQNSQENVQGAEALPQETENVDKSEKSETVNITLVSFQKILTLKSHLGLISLRSHRDLI